MLREEFETWPANFIPNAILLTFAIHIINLGYLEIGPFSFTKLPDNNTKELNKTLKRLDNALAIPNNNDKHPLNLPDSEA